MGYPQRSCCHAISMWMGRSRYIRMMWENNRQMPPVQVVEGSWLFGDLSLPDLLPQNNDRLCSGRFSKMGRYYSVCGHCIML